jgi:hypothetical protein
MFRGGGRVGLLLRRTERKGGERLSSVGGLDCFIV